MFKRTRVTLPALRTVLVIGMVCALAAGKAYTSHGPAAAKKPEGAAAEKAEKPAGGHGGQEAPAAPAFTLGPPLGGFYDRSTLRSTRHVTRYRIMAGKLRQLLNQESPWLVEMDCAIEFGSESGMAEAEQKKDVLNVAIGKTLEGFRPQELMTVTGKMRLKEAIVAALNRRLLTARVRQVYLTEFLIQR